MTELEGKTLLNRYFLRSHLGAGGMADVYLAWDTMRSTHLAVKVLRRDLAGDPRFFQRFEREAELLRKLEHPHIARIFEFDRAGENVFLVMEWIDGHSLRDAIHENKTTYTVGQVSAMLQPLSAALYYAHQKNIYHCDVKPANILLHKDGRIYLTDFGVARFSNEKLSGGTPPYMAPEQIMGDQIDARTDIYAFGITLYEILSGGKVPYRGEHTSSKGSTLQERIAWEHLYLPLPPLRQFNASISSAIEQVLITALDKDPARRYKDVMQFSEAFKRAARVGSQTGVTIHTDLVIPGKKEKPLPPSKTASRRSKKTPHGATSISGPYIYCRGGSLQGQVITIPREGLRLGRSSQNQVVLPERSVSRMHAIFYITAEGAFVRDENSSLGTELNGQRINGAAPVSHGDIIKIGHHQIFEFRNP